ncbi:AtzH-like domain-containing protein [uncultured Selenomonas sp.]|uniref:YybH family protein n=1 Tax=uncultured Selenomonas sp. TaxID=159275 RepID=UPI0025F5CBA5|nr:AtzH-like domain-containing protein [uncultured Selenomonas sp.]
MTVREGDAAIVEQFVDLYKKTLNDANTALADSIWQSGPKTSMVHPRGEDVGWENIRQHFYIDRLQKLYTERHFEFRDLEIEVYRDTAIAMYTWDFHGKLRSDGTEIEHKGRTSQTYRRTSQEGWKILHAHISGMPITNERQQI